jgi:hypothetical protein
VKAEIIQAPDLARAEARMPRWMVAVAAAGALATLVAGSPRAAIGFSVGAVFGILNYFWLHQTIAALMNSATARVPKRTVVKMFLRFPLWAAGIFLFYETGWLPIVAVMAGLLVPGAGVFIESLVLIGAGFREKSEARS